MEIIGYFLIGAVIIIGSGLILWDCLKDKSQQSKEKIGWGEPGV